tara:strand:- start:6717 stop:7415 length:699 start_codon:yes stop_codon:yes gene_type:complete
MPLINFENNNFYYEIEGHGSPLVLAHPYMSSTSHWHKSGWVDVLKNNNKLIMFDYTGHGKSSCPDEIEKYYISYVSEVMIQILNENNITNFSVFGFSMGGRICYELIRNYNERIVSMIIGGMHSKPPASHKKIISYKEENLSPIVKEKFDLKGLKLSNEAQNEWIGAEDIIQNYLKPCLMFAGSEDPYYNWIESSANKFKNCELISMNGLGHIGAFWRINRIKEKIKNFLKL